MIRLAPRFLLLAALGLLPFAGGCSTPTLPLPPPAALTATPPDADGLVTVEGEVIENAYVFCFNEITERGVIGRADEMGRFSLQVEASPGDQLSVWQEIGRDVGEMRLISVPPP